jgi:hypothetical protein
MQRCRTNQGGADVAGVKRDDHIDVVRKTAPVFQVDRPKLEGKKRGVGYECPACRGDLPTTRCGACYGIAV